MDTITTDKQASSKDVYSNVRTMNLQLPLGLTFAAPPQGTSEVRREETSASVSAAPIAKASTSVLPPGKRI